MFPEVLLCPTGGVSLDDIDRYLRAGAALVVTGSNLIDRAALEVGDRHALVERARGYLRAGVR